MAAYRVLGIAAATGRIGYVLLDGQCLVDWGLSKAASRTPELTAIKVRRWIELLRPEVVVSERLGAAGRKGKRTAALLAAIAMTARAAAVVHATVVRQRTFKNKYLEAAALAERFAELRPRLPRKPPIWRPEPTAMILFEALTLALSIRSSAQR